MNAISDRSLKQISWSTIVMFALGFWLSGSLILDTAIVPAIASMMTQQQFASAGYIIFGVFNRIELLCAALVLTSFLVFYRNHNLSRQQERWAIVLSVLLLAIATTYTYILTPQMSGLGSEFGFSNLDKTMPAGMISLHWSYWILEGFKFVAGATLLRWCYRNSCTLD